MDAGAGLSESPRDLIMQLILRCPLAWGAKVLLGDGEGFG